MNYKIEIEAVNEDSVTEQIFEEILKEIVNKCISEVMVNEQSHNISASID
jgi:hypothetical protein